MALVGVVATSYPRWDGDAAGSFVAGHAAWLRAHGDDVDIVAAGRGLPVPDGLFFGGGAPEAIERGGPGVMLAAAGFSTRMLAEVARRARRWDAVVAHWLAPSAVAAALATATRRIPMLAVAHGGDVHLLARARLLAPVCAVLVARDARIAFVSDELRRRTLDAVPRALAGRVDARAIVQAMGVDDARSEAIAQRRAARSATSSTTVVVLARLVPVKSVDTAIAAMAHLPAHAQLVIAGDGPLRAELAAQAARFGDRVRFAGWMDADARDALLAAADVVVVPSAPTLTHARTEGTPMAALEALAAGVPLVASATGGLRELAPHGATLVPPRDPRALADAIECVLRLGASRLAQDERGRLAQDERGRLAQDERMRRGWRVVGEALARHWRAQTREHRYAPAPHAARSRCAQWSSRPSDSPDTQSHSSDLPVTEAC